MPSPRIRPVFILHLYDRALLNGAALRAVGYNKATRTRSAVRSCAIATAILPELLLAQPTRAFLYSTLAKGPKLPQEYQKNSSRHFMREVQSLGVTGRHRTPAVDFRITPKTIASSKSCTAGGKS